jgi:hypothetical protein
LATIAGCGGRKPSVPAAEAAPVTPRVVALDRVFQVETDGPSLSDTSVTFTTGSARDIVVYHSGEGIAFARLGFDAAAFGDSGSPVQVEIRPNPGIYGLEFTTSRPFRGGLAEVTFVYSRYFSAPARARQVYGSDVAFERALAVGRLLPNNQVELLPSSRPAADHLRAAIPSAGNYVVAAPQ